MATDRAIAQAFREVAQCDFAKGGEPRSFVQAVERRAAELDATPPAGAGEAVDYVPGVLDATAPKRIWLQVDTDALREQRDEPFPADIDGVTWQDESIGGLEVEYVRADLAAPTPLPEAVRELIEAAREIESDAEVLGMCTTRLSRAIRKTDELDRALTGGDKQGEEG